jgi:hypothetical protein
MKWITEDARLVCAHKGVVNLKPTQTLVTIQSRLILVDSNPEARPIAGCPQPVPASKPCTLTFKVQTGYSDLIRINGQRICLDTVRGKTDGLPAGAFDYFVEKSGQDLVDEV